MSTLVHNADKLVTVTPTITATSYSTGKQVGGINVIPSVLGADHSIVVLQSLVLVDKAKQSIATDIFFFDDLPTLVSVDTGTFDLTAAQAALSCIGVVNVPAANYATTNTPSVATVPSINLYMKGNVGNNGVQRGTGVTFRDLYCVLVSRGSPTYASTSDLVLKMIFAQR